jgi:hypothetical protein
VLEEDLGSASEAGLQQNEGAMGVDGKCFGFFLDWISLCVDAANANGNLH